jgi:FxsC-like protein
MSFWFFLSYARYDRDSYLDKFYEDLCKAITLNKYLPKDTVGFYDTESIKTGDPWKETLAATLCTSRVMICLCTPAYSNRDYCGKEFQIFYERQQAYILQHQDKHYQVGTTPRVIFPILWGRPSEDFPRVIKDLQYTDNEFPAEYAKEGLYYLINLKSYADHYKQFIMRLAAKIVEAGTKYELPELSSLKPLEEVKNAFAQSVTLTTAQNKNFSAGGHKNVRFVFVAARPDEIQGMRDVEWYGDEGGKHWQPYWPEYEDPVGVLAQEAATRLRLFFHELPLDENLKDYLDQAEERRESVIIIVDVWSVCIQKYLKFMSMYDKVNYKNCAVLIPWNELDQETSEHQAMLKKALEDAFEYKAEAKHSLYFQDTIRSIGELQNGLLDTISRIRMKFINSEEPKQKITSERLAQEARDKGIVIDKQPVVAASGGNTL